MTPPSSDLDGAALVALCRRWRTLIGRPRLQRAAGRTAVELVTLARALVLIALLNKVQAGVDRDDPDRQALDLAVADFAAAVRDRVTWLENRLHQGRRSDDA